MNIVNNIYCFLKAKKIFIGDFEHSCGVSAGFLSRSMKNGHKPSIEFVIKAADYLNLTLDTLARVDMKDMNETEWYLMPFIDKLLKQTEYGKLSWKTDGTRIKAEILPGKWVSINCKNGVKSLFLEIQQGNTEKPAENCIVEEICKPEDYLRLRKLIDILDSTARANIRPLKLDREVYETIETILNSDKKEA